MKDDLIEVKDELLCIGGAFHGWTTLIPKEQQEVAITEPGKEHVYIRVQITHGDGSGDALFPSEIMPRVRGCVKQR